jgi:hypothetical protein
MRLHASLVGPFAVLSIAALGSVYTSGCGTTNGGGGFGVDASTDSSGGDDTSTDDGGSNDGPSLINDAGDGAGNCTSCSADLHTVIDCNNPPNVIMQCTGNTGCGPNGQCVPACQAAAANQSSIGCDYYAIPADGWSDIPEFNPGTSDGSCFAAFVTNQWASPLKVTLVWKGKTIDATPFSYVPQGSGANITYQPIPSTGIPANQMAIVFLAQYGQAAAFKTLCPASVQAAVQTEDVGQHGTGFGNAMEIQTSVPAVVYDIYPYGGALSYTASATLLLPVDVWDTNYVAASTWPGFMISGQGRPMDIDFVGMKDGTKVQFLPSAAVEGGNGVPATAAATQVTYTLNKGQLLHLTQIADLSGSVVQSSNPVGVWGEHYCMNIPDMNTAACDAGHQQIPPVKALGSEYVAVAYESRGGGPETVPWRIMGTVKGTTLTWDPAVTGAPTSLSVGQLVEFQAPGPFVVKSQDDKHPFYITAHMTGGSSPGAGGNGDPETVNIVPPQQFLPSYTFFTDPTYSFTDLVLVRGKAQDGTYKDVTIDCANGPIPGWQPIGSGKYQYTRIDVQQNHAPVGNCDNGRHTMKSASPFGITVWGYDQYVSYAYPAGASVKPINTVVVPPNPQ